MNKREKEIAQVHLDNEKAVLKELEKMYQKSLGDINRKIRILQSDELTQSKVYQLEYQQALKGQVSAILDKLHGDEFSTIQQYLSNTYTDSFVGAVYEMHGQGMPLIMPIDQKAAVKAILTDSKISDGLYSALGVDTNKLKTAIRHEITRGIASSLPYHDIARNISNTTKTPLARAGTIVRTEAHRIQQASKYDAQKAAKEEGCDVVKQWNSSLDGDTRPTHRKLDGQIKEVDEPFEVDGKKAMYPGDFGDPAEDCNCRCGTLTRAKWMLDEDELQTLKDRAEYFGLDKSESFEDFKKTYLKAAESLENTGKSDIIDMYRQKPTHRKITEDGRHVIDRATYNKVTAPAVKKGADIRTADESMMQYLESNHATAVTFGDTIILRPDATTTEVLEEVYHFNQNRSGLNAQYSAVQRQIMNEIDAQEYLLSVSDKYKIPKEEVEETKQLLEVYKKKMEDMKKAGEWDD